MSLFTATVAHGSHVFGDVAVTPATNAISEARGLKSLGRRFGEYLRTAERVDAQATIDLSFRLVTLHIDAAELWTYTCPECGECVRLRNLRKNTCVHVR